MSLASPFANRVLTWLAIIAFSALAGHAYSTIGYDTIPREIAVTWPGIRGGILIGGLSSGFEIFIMRGPVGHWLRQRSFMAALSLRVLIHTVLVVSALLLNRIISAVLIGGFVANSFVASDLLKDTLFSFAATGLALFILQMRALIGGRTLFNVVIGRYSRPVREDRLFVLIDLAGSTPLAARLGDQRFHDFLSAFFFTIDPALTRSGGEVHSYVGDAVIATWPLSDPQSNRAAIEAVFAARELAAARQDWFQKRFGETPRFRAVIHGGPIIAGECGDSKRQITYLGDVLNTTARLEALAKQLDTEALVTQTVLDQVVLPTGIKTVPLGSHTLKGLNEPLAVFGLGSVAISST